MSRHCRSPIGGYRYPVQWQIVSWAMLFTVRRLPEPPPVTGRVVCREPTARDQLFEPSHICCGRRERACQMPACDAPLSFPRNSEAPRSLWDGRITRHVRRRCSPFRRAQNRSREPAAPLRRSASEQNSSERDMTSFDPPPTKQGYIHKAKEERPPAEAVSLLNSREIRPCDPLPRLRHEEIVR